MRRVNEVNRRKQMKQNKLTFESENLEVDWISLNLEGWMDPRIIANRLSKYFTPHVLIDDVPGIGFHGFQKKYKVSIRQYTGSKGYWVGTKIIFSGKDAAYFYKLIKTQRLDWSLLKFDEHSLSLSRIDLCFSRPNDWSDTSKSFDGFLVDSRSQIQDHTTTKYIKLQDFPNGKMLKVNRRNNLRHYRVYQRDENVRFELELKHRQTKLVQDYLFENQLDVFEHQYLLQFLSFVKGLKLNTFKDCKKLRVKTQFYYELKFPLSQFVKFTGMQLSHQSDREKLLFYFYQLQKLDPILKVFLNLAFRSYVCFPYVNCANPSGKSWFIEVLAAEELSCFPYPFQLPKSFLHSGSKNDLRLKVRLMKSLAVSDQKKRLDLEEFFNTINVRNDPLIRIKKNLIQLLSELVENKIIQNKMEVILKSGKKKDRLIQNLTTSDITRRIKYIQLHEIHQKIV